MGFVSIQQGLKPFSASRAVRSAVILSVSPVIFTSGRCPSSCQQSAGSGCLEEASVTRLLLRSPAIINTPILLPVRTNTHTSHAHSRNSSYGSVRSTIERVDVRAGSDGERRRCIHDRASVCVRFATERVFVGTGRYSTDSAVS